ncbi:MAG: DNA internalization-related competence protein ComEC/Rec2 [Clostridiales bacterium]|nr:DNA internalization-related competence protein ComEC/Rec2 [Clostridiales bacterium]
MKNNNMPHDLDTYFDEKIGASIIGRVRQVEDKETYQLIILEEGIIVLDNDKKIGNDRLVSNDRFYSGGLKVYNKLHMDLKIGQTISLKGEISKFQKATNPGQFDEYTYNKILKNDYKIYCDRVQVINEEYSPYNEFLQGVKNKIGRVYKNSLSSQNSGILSAMVLGDKASLDTDIKALYQTHGISHILSISGLHVSLIGMTIYKLLRKTGIPIVLAAFLSIIFIYSYGVLTGFGVSTLRAVIMLILMVFSKILGRTYDIISAASLSGLIILINNPLQIFSTGFLLSFGAVLGIGLIYPFISNVFPIKNKFIKVIVDSLLISLSVQIVTLPILLYFFFEVSVYSVLFNVILVPFVSVIIGLAIIGGVLGAIYLPLGIFFLAGSSYILDFYEWVLSIANRLPYHTLILGRPKEEVILIYYIILLVFLLLNYWKESKYSSFILFGLVLIFVPFRASNLEVTFIDVGQGDGTLIESGNGKKYLVDGGSSSVGEVGKYRIIPLLKFKGISQLDYVFISHFDKDHVNGIIEILEAMDGKGGSGSIYIETLVLPRYANDPIRNEVNSIGGYDSYEALSSLDLTEDDMYKQVISIARDKGVKVVYMGEGDYIKDGDMIITCLHPIDDFYYFNKNASSLVLSVDYKDFAMLLTGDVEEEGEENLNDVLLERNINLDFTSQLSQYDILQVAHHGSKNSTYNEFLQLTKPRYSIISCGKNTSYGHPHKELLDRLEDFESRVYISYESGAISVITDGSSMIIDEFIKE